MERKSKDSYKYIRNRGLLILVEMNSFNNSQHVIDPYMHGNVAAGGLHGYDSKMEVVLVNEHAEEEKIEKLLLVITVIGGREEIERDLN